MASRILIGLLIIAFFVVSSATNNFNQYFDITWGDGRGKILNNGQLLTLSLDKASGSGFRSKNEYLFGKIDMQLKLVPGNSAFPRSQAMSIYSSLWDADNWATRGGLVKTDWAQAPFTASYGDFNIQACVWTSSSGSSCSPKTPSSSNQPWMKQSLDSTGYARIQWVQKNYMIYNYCTDTKRFPQGLPPECSHRLRRIIPNGHLELSN